MNIGFDAKRYFHNQSGLGNYSRDLVNSLIKLQPKNKYYLFDPSPSTLNLPPNTIAVVPQNNSMFWRIKGIQKDIELHKIDIFHGLSNELPFGKWPSMTKKVVSIHDVIFKIFPNHYSVLDREIYHQKTKHALQIADKIVATSQSTAADLIKYYGLSDDKVNVIYQTCGEGHWKTYSQESLNSFAFNKRLPLKFTLYVSSFQTRKNHLQLLKGLKESGLKDINLVLAGKRGETLELCKQYIDDNGLGKQVLILNDLQNSELPMLYRCASSFIYPSMVEGFGIPLIEAACAGLPLAVNDISVFRELAPASALKFDSNDVNSIVESILLLNKMDKLDYGVYLEKFKTEYASEQMNALYNSCFE
jgi:glycosyltransferase involved in cell wall biosynthesis